MNPSRCSSQAGSGDRQWIAVQGSPLTGLELTQGDLSRLSAACPPLPLTPLLLSYIFDLRRSQLPGFNCCTGQLHKTRKHWLRSQNLYGEDWDDPFSCIWGYGPSFTM